MVTSQSWMLRGLHEGLLHNINLVCHYWFCRTHKKTDKLILHRITPPPFLTAVSTLYLGNCNHTCAGLCAPGPSCSPSCSRPLSFMAVTTGYCSSLLVTCKISGQSHNTYQRLCVILPSARVGQIEQSLNRVQSKNRPAHLCVNKNDFKVAQGHLALLLEKRGGV